MKNQKFLIFLKTCQRATQGCSGSIWGLIAGVGRPKPDPRRPYDHTQDGCWSRIVRQTVQKKIQWPRSVWDRICDGVQKNEKEVCGLHHNVMFTQRASEACLWIPQHSANSAIWTVQNTVWSLPDGHVDLWVVYPTRSHAQVCQQWHDCKMKRIFDIKLCSVSKQFRFSFLFDGLNARNQTYASVAFISGVEHKTSSSSCGIRAF